MGRRAGIPRLPGASNPPSDLYNLVFRVGWALGIDGRRFKVSVWKGCCYRSHFMVKISNHHDSAPLAWH